MKWGFEALVKNEYSGLTLYDGSGNPYSGATQITALGMDDGLYIWICAVVLGAIVLFLIGISYYALNNIVSKNDRNKKNCATAPGKNGQVVDGGPVPVPVEMQGVVVQDV
ncbi:hypothetical protein HKX48_002492 [Thoreauomyces humboldtii]|nr:hypothetical protein HKX48_002492 [Thoreauomyces humboldtii]